MANAVKHPDQRVLAQHPPTVRVWANGFGIWHVRVPKSAASTLVTARAAIASELTARSDNVHRHWWMHLERDCSLDDDDTVVWVEPSTPVDSCTWCAMRRTKGRP